MKNKTIIFRADGNSLTGLGHLYRLFALVEMLSDEFDYVFLTKESSEISVIPNNFNLKLIPDSVTYENEPEWLNIEYDPYAHLIIADGYRFDSLYQSRIKKVGYKLIYIDDLAKEYMYADIVVNHAPGFTVKDYSGEDYVYFALGTDYSLLRPVFLKEAGCSNEEKKDCIDTVFICFGGADKFNLTEKFVRVLLTMSFIKKIKVVLGASNKDIKLHKLKKKFPQRLEVYKNLSEVKLKDIMASCNLAIAPSSTICFELFALKIPVISGFFVENQIRAYSIFRDMKCFFGVGDFKLFNYDNLSKIIKGELFEKYMNVYHVNQSKIIDGLQKERLLRLLNILNLN